MTDLPTSLPCNWARTRQPHPPHDWEPQPGMNPVHCPGCGQGDTGEPELTAEEARELADDLGLQLYRAQDALAFVEECCTIADREQRVITTADVREWLRGARCGRQLADDAARAEGTDTATWTAVRAIQLMNEAGQQRDEALAAISRVRGLADRLDEFAENALRVDDQKLYAAIASDIRTRIDGPASEATDGPPCSCGGRFPLAHLHADQHQPMKET